MWDERDYTSRWIQGICAIFLGLFALFMIWYTLNHFIFLWIIGGFGLTYGSARLAWRCGLYAITGKGNVNRDDF